MATTQVGAKYGRLTVLSLSMEKTGGQWHPLKAETTGAVWRATGDIGSKDAPAGTQYKLIAISGAKEITGPVLKRPRGEAKSRTIIVCRA